MAENKQKCFRMMKLLKKATRLKNFLEALHATNVSFHQCNKPTEAIKKLSTISATRTIFMATKLRSVYYPMLSLFVCPKLILA